MADDTASRAEAFLFTEGGSLSLRKLAALMKMKEPELQTALEELSRRLEGRGLALIKTDTEVSLAVAPDASGSVRAAYRAELEKDIGDAGLEVLAIVLYRGPIARSEINYLRGVNSNYILRALLVRGLIEKAENSSARSTVYRPTFELLSYMGVSKVADLPEYEESAIAVEEFHKSNAENGHEEE